MAIKYRQELGRPLTYAEGDENFRTLEDSIEKTLAEYPTLADAMADDIPDGVVFIVNDGDYAGYWRRDSSNTEGAEFLREFPENISDRITQETGDSETDVMSQASVTKELIHNIGVAGDFVLEQGGISSVTGELLNRSDRVRTTMFKGGFKIDMNDGYALYHAASYSEDGEFLGNILPQNANRDSGDVENENWTRLVFTHTGGSGNISPDEDIFDTKETGVALFRKFEPVKVNRLGFVLTGRSFNINLVDNEIEIDGNCFFLVGDEYKVLSNLTFPIDRTSSTTFIYYDLEANTIVNRPHQPAADHEYFLGFIRGLNPYINGNYSIDGVFVDVKQIGQGGGGGGDSDYFTYTYIMDGENFLIDTIQSTITIANTTFILADNQYTNVAPTTIDYSGVSGTTKFIFYDLDAKEFIVTSETGTVAYNKSFVGFIRRGNVWVNGSYTLNGVLITGGSSGGRSDRTTTIVNTNYTFEGDLMGLPQEASDVYSVYDSLTERFPQYVSKEVLGKARDVVSMDVDSANSLPFSVRVQSLDNLSVGMTVSIEGKEFEIGEIAANPTTSPSVGDQLKLYPVTESGVASSGNIEYPQGGVITSYDRRYYGRFECHLDNDSSFTFFCVDVNLNGNSVEGIFEPPVTGVPTSGNLTDEDGTILSGYSNLTITDGEDINCYEFDFSPRRDESELKNRLFFTGGVHGSEKRAILAHMTFFSQLCENWRDSDELSALRDIRYTVIPVVNPYGMLRHTTYNAHGVDLNRNFEAGFLQTNPLYYRWSGYTPFSEPETVLVKNKIEEVVDTTFLFLDSHNDASRLGGLMVSPLTDDVFANAISRNINTMINRHNPQIPTYLWAWTSGQETVWSLVEAPSVGGTVYVDINSSDGAETIDSVSGNSIVVGGVSYSRNSSQDVDYTNFYNTINDIPAGSTAYQANSLGIHNAFVVEHGGNAFMTPDERLVLHIEITANVIASTTKYLLS